MASTAMLKLNSVTLLVVSSAGGASAFASSYTGGRPLARQLVSRQPRTSVMTMNAAVLPTSFRLLAAGSVWRAMKCADATSSAMLLSTAAVALFDLAPASRTHLASAKRAIAMECDGALAWRSVLRVKLFGQLAGLVVSVGSGNALGGVSCIVGADVAFWALGGGAKRFECDEESDGGVRRAPIAASLAKALLMSVNAAMLLSVLASYAFGQSSPLLRKVKGGAAVFCAGVLSQTIGDAKALVCYTDDSSKLYNKTVTLTS